MTNSNSDVKPINELLYDSVIKLLSEIKLAHGADFLNSTLRRHKKIKDFLLQYQKDKLSEFDDKIKYNFD